MHASSRPTQQQLLSSTAGFPFTTNAGATLNSVLGIGMSESLDRIQKGMQKKAGEIRALKVIIIDEASMLSAELMQVGMFFFIKLVHIYTDVDGFPAFCEVHVMMIGILKRSGMARLSNVLL